MNPSSPRARPRRRRRWSRRILGWTVTLTLTILILRVSGCAESLFYVPTREPTPAPTEFKGARVVRFESADGTRLCGWFIPASESGESPSSAPSILHVHGNAGNMLGHFGFTDFLPGAGFNVFLFDYRGYGESEGSPRRRAPLIADANAALDAMLAQPEVDRSRVGMFAQSLGGAIGLNLMAMRPEIRCAVLESPISSWRFAAATAVGGAEPGVIARTLAALLISDELRPDEAIAVIERPVLILHGDADRIVPVVHGRRLRDAAPAQVTLVELPGGDHNSLQFTHPFVRRLAVEFLRKNLEP